MSKPTIIMNYSSHLKTNQNTKRMSKLNKRLI